MRGSINPQAVAACGCAACGNTRATLSVVDTALGPQALCGTCAAVVLEDFSPWSPAHQAWHA